jgi:hypothetical protein
VIAGKGELGAELGFSTPSLPSHSKQPRRQEFHLSYLFGVGGVLLLQVAFSFAIIFATSGGGSFVGLGAMLLAVLGIPLTALINFLLIRSNRKNPASPCVLRIALVSLALPVAQLALMILVSVFRL